MSGQWDKEFTKGKIAENVFSFIIKSMIGWECIEYGMENHVQVLKDTLRENKDAVSFNIRSMPDFIVANKKQRKAYFVDVKYRDYIDNRDPKRLIFSFPYGQIKNYLEFWPNALIVVIHDYPPYFYVIPVSSIQWHIHFRDRYISESNQVIEHWDFMGICLKMSDIFPEIKEEKILEAVKLLPKGKYQ